MSLGIFMQRVLPEGHLSSDSKEVVKLSMGVVATLAALVLGLLVASAKSSYDARESEINQITASVILLDNLLAKYGEGAEAARASLRQAVPAVVNRIWREAQSVKLQATPFHATAEGEAFYQQVQDLHPTNDHATWTADADHSGHQRSDASALPFVFASWQLDTPSLFGSATALADNIVRWLCSYGVCKRDDLGVAGHMCAVSLRGNFSYSRTQ